jgi:hypothetical protein
MLGVTATRYRTNQGFSLMEVLIALALTMIVIGSVFTLLHKGQDSFRREPEVTDMTANARAGMGRISQDLTIAGFNTPPNLAIMWNDGGGLTPDELTVIYADPDVPISRPMQCSTGGGGGNGGGGGGGPCNTIGTSSVLNIDPESFSTSPADFEAAYQDGMVLLALQGPNGDPACDALPPGITPFELTQPPSCTGAGGSQSGPAGCATLNLNHNPGHVATEINLPGGFQNDVSSNCAIIGLFHIIQYRINPLPPADNPSLERRDLALGTDWIPVSGNIENLQIQYTQGLVENFEDTPTLIPMGNDPNSFITRVRVTVAGRSESTNLQGGTVGVFAPEDTYLRRTFTTTVSLRNQLAHAQAKAMELDVPGWN